MKKIWIILGFVVLVLAVVILSATGIIDISWQDLSMIAAAAVAPLKMLFDKLGGQDEVDKIVDNQKQRQQEEKEHREKMDALIAEKTKRIEELNKELEVQDAKLQVVEEKKKRVATEVKSMTIEETKKEAMDLFGE